MLGDLSAEKYSTDCVTRLRFYISSVNKEYANHLFIIFGLNRLRVFIIKIICPNTA